MPLVFGCISPHGGETVPRLAGKQLELFGPTRKGMRTLASRLKASGPDTIVVATPHNLRLDSHIGVVVAENSSGSVSEGRNRIALRVACDVDFARRVLAAGVQARLPVVGANYGALEGPASDMAMDWGTAIPLWFFVKESGLECRVVIVTPSRGIPLRQNFEFGRLIGEAARETRKRIAFVASADQAHTHSGKGPYGFSPNARAYDEEVISAVKSNSLGSLLSLSPRLVESAKPDSLWQMMMLSGALEASPLRGELVSYQVPTYYGMLCASYS